MNSLKEWLKNLGLFYVLILIIISIPILTVLAVLSIKTLVELRYWIAGTIGILSCTSAYLLYKKRKKYKEELKKSKEDILRILEHAIESGHDIDISFMGGLLKISYRNSHNRKALPHSHREVPSLPQEISH